MIRSTSIRRRTAAILVLATMGLLLLAAAPAEQTAPSGSKIKGDPYPLDTCAVAGVKLDSKGDPVVFVYEGREFRFCCGGCLSKFKKDPAKYTAKVDEKIIKQQMPYYPMTTCLVMSEESLEGPDAEPYDVVMYNRLLRFCCKGCVRKVSKSPEKYLAQLDEAIVKAQMKDYPLDTCVVGGGELGSMGDAVNYVVNTRLVRLCCKGCVKSLKKDPTKYIAKIDAAKSGKKEKSGA